MDRMTMQIDGMSCAHCVKAVRDALSELPGVQVERVDVGSATVAYDDARVTKSAVLDAVRDAGYEPAGA
jgi:copper ion binding protein